MIRFKNYFTLNDRYEYHCNSNDYANGMAIYDKKTDVFYPQITSESYYEEWFDDFIHGRTLVLKRTMDRKIDLSAIYERVFTLKNITDKE